MLTQESQPITDAGFHLPTGYRQPVEDICAIKGCTIDEFISAAVADKLADYAHEKWVSGLRRPTDKEIQYALDLLNRPDSRAPEPGDELPEGYVSPAPAQHPLDSTSGE
jgi:hypothetical protein